MRSTSGGSRVAASTRTLRSVIQCARGPTLVEPRCEAPAGWPPLVRLSRACPQVGRRLGLCLGQ